MNKIIMPAVIFFFCSLTYLQAAPKSGGTAGQITLEECYRLAKNNYPLVKQEKLIEKSREYSVSNITKGYLPRINISGKATYQSDVTQLPVSFPGINIQTLSRDQYSLYGEISQPVTDIVRINEQIDLQETESLIGKGNLEAELYKIKDRINQLYFGILLLNEQLKLNELLKKDIGTGISKVKAAIANGADFMSSLQKLEAELLNADQKTIELNSSRKAYLDMLGTFINKTVDENTIFEKPVGLTITGTINRPELSVFDLQEKSYSIQSRLITANDLPKLELFFQEGFGKPSPVNLLAKDFSSYYMGGVRLSWPLHVFYTYSREREGLEVSRLMTDAQKETFLFNTNLTLKQFKSDITRQQEFLKTDERIIELRDSVKTTANVQLENGVITVNDYIKEIDAEDQARQNKALHEIELLSAQYNYQYTAGY